MILSQVPFVDVVTTMLDASIPLTTNEYDEWGNPEQKRVLRLHAVVLAVRQPQGAGLSGDVRRHRPVGFAGAVLRAGQVRGAPARPQHRRTLPVLFRTNMDAGHGGKSGRFRRYRELAEMYAFLLDQLGVRRSGGRRDEPALYCAAMKTSAYTMLRCFIAAALLATLAACGNKGPLVKPSQAPPGRGHRRHRPMRSRRRAGDPTEVAPPEKSRRRPSTEPRQHRRPMSPPADDGGGNG